MDHVRASIQLGELEFVHTLVDIARLVIVGPVVVRVDFLHKKGLTLDFTHTLVKVSKAIPGLGTQSADACAAMASSKESNETDEVDEYAAPIFSRCASIELLHYPKPEIRCGCQFPSQGSWTPGGKETTRSNLSRTLTI